MLTSSWVKTRGCWAKASERASSAWRWSRKGPGPADPMRCIENRAYGPASRWSALRTLRQRFLGLSVLGDAQHFFQGGYTLHRPAQPILAHRSLLHARHGGDL